MKIVFLGTNGWYDTPTGNTVCALIKTKRWDIVLDAGNGIYKLDQYCDGTKPVFLLLSHFHLDHIAGLHLLVKFRFKKGLTICGHKGARRLLKTFINRPFTVPIDKLPYPVKLLELPAQAGELPFKITTLPLVHADPVLGMRLELEGKTITYCTDTGYCPNASKLAKGADLLITECAHAPGESNPAWPHFNPETAAKLAVEAGAKRLAITHFSADRYRTAAARAAGLKLSRKIFPEAIGAKDGMQIDI
ncbi:MAG: MBL fold metallo-hydrolase [Elusimicrobiota bacterium]|nr:MBL fold metallo-hydrolase [Elusimicrobiota bacterium]